MASTGAIVCLSCRLADVRLRMAHAASMSLANDSAQSSRQVASVDSLVHEELLRVSGGSHEDPVRTSRGPGDSPALPASAERCRLWRHPRRSTRPMHGTGFDSLKAGDQILEDRALSQSRPAKRYFFQRYWVRRTTAGRKQKKPKPPPHVRCFT